MAEFVAHEQEAALSAEKDASGSTPSESPSQREAPTPASPDTVITASLAEQENGAAPPSHFEEVCESPDLDPQLGTPSADAKLYGEAVMALKIELGDTHFDTLTALNNRAATLFSQNDLKGAAFLFKEAIKDKRGSLGAHASTALSIANLGKLYKLSGKPRRAREYLQEAYEMRQELLGKKHADTLQSANHLGSLLYALRDFEGAERILSDTLTRSRKTRGDTDPITLTTINNLGNVLHSKGDLSGALKLLKEAVTSSRATQGEDHVETLISISNLGMLLKDMAFRGSITPCAAEGEAGEEEEGGEGRGGGEESGAKAQIVGDLNGDGEIDEAERRRVLFEEGQALLIEAAKGFRHKRLELGEGHPHVRCIGSPDWEADLDLSAFTVSQGAPASSESVGGGGPVLAVHAGGQVNAETRTKLRQVFDKFDEDHSGAVSTFEMRSMIAQLDLRLSDDEVVRLMTEADPDGSGQIEFEEFVAVMADQMKQGGGGLVDIVSAAGNLFGWINPLSWFGGGQK